MKRRVLFIALLVLALGVFAWLALRPREPVYQGKTLTEWLTVRTNGDLTPDAAEAIHHIGTNEIPTLLQMLRAHDSNLKLQLIGLAAKQHIVKIDFIYASQRNMEAAALFGFLGPAASNAVPELIQILKKKVSSQSQWSTIDSLASIGPAAKAAVPELVCTVGDTNADRDVRTTAIAAVGEFQVDAALVVPALIKCLKDSDFNVRAYAAASLGDFGSDAKAAVPALVDLLKDPIPEMSGEAAKALKTIDPEAAAKAGVQ